MPDIILRNIPVAALCVLRVHAREEREKWEQSRRFRSTEAGRNEASEMETVWRTILAQLEAPDAPHLTP